MFPFRRGVAAAVLALPLAATAAAQDADRIWTGGPVLTMNDAAMRAEAVAEKDGRILAVGPAAEVMAHRGPATQVIDLGGRALLPGFFDAHGHVFVGGLQALSANLLAPPDGTVGAGALKSRFTRSSGQGAALSLIVVLSDFPHTIPCRLI